MNNKITYPIFISNEFIDFSESIRIFQFCFTFFKIPFLKKKIEAIIAQLLVQSPRKVLYVIWNFGTKTSEICNVTSIF